MFTLVIPIPEELTTALHPLRQKYDPLANRMAAHISVLPPFDFFGPPETLYDHLTTIGDTYAPVKVSIAGWDIHRSSQGYHLRLPVMAGRAELATLRNSLCTDVLASLAEQKEAGHWPYIQFGQVASLEELQEIKKQLLHFEPQFIFRATGLDLLHCPSPSLPWQAHQTFGLMATLTSPRRATNTPPLRFNPAVKS